MYNKELFRQAGLDPEKPPTTLAEFDAAARAVDALGGDVNGTFFGGSCGGCNVFTWWPISWADGEPVMNPEGTESYLEQRDDEGRSTPRSAPSHEDGITAPGTQEEQGPTWTAFFPQGNIGIMPMPASLQGMANDKLKDEDIGVTPIAGVNGGQSTFVGGDSIGISRDSKVADQAWNFLAWMLDDEAQVEVVAKGGNVVARTDLADNQYSSADPRLVLFNTVAGRRPDAVRAELRRRRSTTRRDRGSCCCMTRCSATRASSTPTTTPSTTRCSRSGLTAGPPPAGTERVGPSPTRSPGIRSRLRLDLR